ncbi:MAG: helix-turn-helix domain-containing protein, partial [Cyclobacteriaceae bacterium]
EKLRSLRPAIPFDRAILELTRASGNLSIDYIAAQSCLSQRQFQRKSLERIGIAPKLYARLVRFSHAYKYKETFPESPWVKIAHRFDYFDHMHFIRDFKAFSGAAPGISNEMDNKTSVKFYQLME